VKSHLVTLRPVISREPMNTASRILIARCAWPLRNALRELLPAGSNAQLWRARLTATGSAPHVEATSEALLLCDLPAAADLSSADVQLWIGALIGTQRQDVPVDAAGMICYFMSIDAQHEEEFNAWYDTEHIPRLVAVPGVLSARRFRAIRGRQQYVAVYYFADQQLPMSPAWRNAAGTPWTAHIARYRYDNERFVCAPASFV
jgi:hypothetical protein